MAIVVRAYVLCVTDDPVAAEGAVYTPLNGAAFESANPILDVATGVEQRVLVTKDYRDGSFLTQIPSAALLKTFNADDCTI